MADVIMMHQPDGTIEYVSPSVKRILGYEPEELLGQNPYEFYFHPLDAERIREESHEQLLVGETATNAEYRIKRKNGLYTWFETTSEVILDEHQQVSAIVTSSRDISSRKKEEKQADQLREHLQASQPGAGKLCLRGFSRSARTATGDCQLLASTTATLSASAG